MSRTNYIFIDYENVQETDLDQAITQYTRIVLVLGARHTSLPLKLVKLIQAHPTQVRLIETKVEGNNALDFVLACEVGVTFENDKDGRIDLISADKGFDALIQHLRGKGCQVGRHRSLKELLAGSAPVVELAKDTPSSRITAHLTKHPVARPGKRKKLESFIRNFFGNRMSPQEIQSSIESMRAEHYLSFSERGEVIYRDQLSAHKTAA